MILNIKIKFLKHIQSARNLFNSTKPNQLILYIFFFRNDAILIFFGREILLLIGTSSTIIVVWPSATEIKLS